MTLRNYYKKNVNFENACLIFLFNVVALIVRERENIIYF